jgi:prolipoprotein diacylglyceryl transferase
VAFLPSPAQSVLRLGPLTVHYYGLMYVLALVAAVAITRRRWEAAGGSGADVIRAATWGFPAGLVGGRLYFLLTSWDQAPHTWWGPLAIWQGGLGSWGGIAAGSATALWALRRDVDVARLADAAVPGLLVGWSIGRVGNYFNQELFGLPTRLPWGLQISPAHRPAGYASFATFHPTFLYEILWNLALAGVLVLLAYHRPLARGTLFSLYVAGYGLGRIFEELLRIDPAHHVLGLRLNFFVAATWAAGGAAWAWRCSRRPRTRLRPSTSP